MPETIYASFADATLCEQAAGALLDYGVRKEDVSLVSHDSYQPGTQPHAAGTVVPSAVSAGDTMGAPALAGQDTVGNSVAFPETSMPASQSDLVSSGHAASNYSDAHAALSNAEYNREYRDQFDAASPDTSATQVGRFGDEATVTSDRLSSPSIATPHADPVVGTDAVEVPGTGAHSSGLDHDQVSSLTHLPGESATVAANTGAAVSAAPAFQRSASVMDEADYPTNDGNPDVEGAAKRGLSVTTAADAEAGAVKGAGWGLGLGVLAGIAALAVPGVGWVVGGGALATAIGGLIGTAVAGAIAGGVTGYLKDQGVPHEAAASYGSAVEQGGAILSVHAPSGNVDPVTIQQILHKYGATNINAY